MASMVGLGEVLWDVFPDGEKLLGGAPANFAFHAHQLGHAGIVVSRIGEDELGQGILRELSGRGLRTDMIEADGERPTGTVHVTVNNDGSHDFLIAPNVAWDRLIATRELLDVVAGADVICFGTLAQRDKSSRSAIDLLLKRSGGMKIFDINLRQDYWSAEIIEAGLKHCRVVKLNDEELDVIRELNLVPSTPDTTAWCRDLLGKYRVDLLALTRGEEGAMLITQDECVDEPGIVVDVADSVGSGDAFTAGMADALLQGAPLQETAVYANRLGAFVASQSGATPTLPAECRQI